MKKHAIRMRRGRMRIDLQRHADQLVGSVVAAALRFEYAKQVQSVELPWNRREHFAVELGGGGQVARVVRC